MGESWELRALGTLVIVGPCPGASVVSYMRKGMLQQPSVRDFRDQSLGLLGLGPAVAVLPGLTFVPSCLQQEQDLVGGPVCVGAEQRAGVPAR